MKLSIAIPVYNFAEFIPETLNSIVLQDWGDAVEIVVTDGASTDGTADVMADFCSRYPNILYNRLPVKGGIDRDLAHAVEATRGQYVWLFSGDDIMQGDALAVVFKLIESGQDLYIGKHLECNRRMEPLCEWPVMEPNVADVFELSDPARRIEYFKRAVNSEAFFSFCGGLIFRRATWDRGELYEEFVGSCFAHSARFFSLMKEGLSVNYTARALLSRRGENDSFSGGGLVNRYRIQVDGFLNIAETFFGRNSAEAREVRRAMRNEFHPPLIRWLKYLCLAQPDVEKKAMLNHIVYRAYQDNLFQCYKVRLLYHLAPNTRKPLKRKFKEFKKKLKGAYLGP